MRFKIERSGKEIKLLIFCSSFEREGEEIFSEWNKNSFMNDPLRLGFWVDWCRNEENSEEREAFVIKTIERAMKAPHNGIAGAHTLTLANFAGIPLANSNSQV